MGETSNYRFLLCDVYTLRLLTYGDCSPMETAYRDQLTLPVLHTPPVLYIMNKWRFRVVT